MASKEYLKKILFPHETIRDVQDELILDVDIAISEGKDLVVHAPTGLGKTSVLGPAVAHALAKKKTVFFLTSRHTQHVLAIETLQMIKEKHDMNFISTDIIGKKWMCAVDGVTNLYSNEFSEYCRAVREDDKCEFYTNTKKSNKLSVKAKLIIDKLKQMSPIHPEKMVEICKEEKLCPYEISTALAGESTAIVADYYYLFSPTVRDAFFARIGKKIEDCIIIVDEGHNLPRRVRELQTERLTSIMLKRAIKEASKFGYMETHDTLTKIQAVLKTISGSMRWGDERLVKPEEFTEKINDIRDYEEVIEELDGIADAIREQQKMSYIGGISAFLTAWTGGEEGFARILSVKEYNKEQIITLSYRCLDPSLLTGKIIDEAYSTVVMSGTLTPTSMYKDLLGMNNAKELSLPSPFKDENRLHLVVPKTTTKYSMRGDAQYTAIAEECAKICNTIPGNVAVFFPSYRLRDDIWKIMYDKTKKTTMLEEPGLTKEEKQEMMEKFKSYNKKGAILLAAASGSFGEGIDLPGDYLKGVVIVGLPLQTPDLEIKELIAYYDKKFSKGWDYGYILPAITITLQNAGRCIRSETDRGAMVFLEERYAWPSYSRCFPPEWDVKISKEYEEIIDDFFDTK